MLTKTATQPPFFRRISHFETKGKTLLHLNPEKKFLYMNRLCTKTFKYHYKTLVEKTVSRRF